MDINVFFFFHVLLVDRSYRRNGQYLQSRNRKRVEMSPPTHQFCLKWNNHSNNLLKVFGRLFSNESFTDVTLAAEGRSIRAHKVITNAFNYLMHIIFFSYKITQRMHAKKMTIHLLSIKPQH